MAPFLARATCKTSAFHPTLCFSLVSSCVSSASQGVSMWGKSALIPFSAGPGFQQTPEQLLALLSFPSLLLGPRCSPGHAEIPSVQDTARINILISRILPSECFLGPPSGRISGEQASQRSQPRSDRLLLRMLNVCESLSKKPGMPSLFSKALGASVCPLGLWTLVLELCLALLAIVIALPGAPKCDKYQLAFWPH